MITAPVKGESCYDQDAQYGRLEFPFTENRDFTVTDNNTGLIWKQITNDGNLSFSGATEYCKNLELANYDDWGIPTTKELFSQTNFEPAKKKACIDTDYFKFPVQTRLQFFKVGYFLH